MPVGGGRYESMWGNKVWFVDYDNGTVGGIGDKPDAAQKNLQTIIDKATEWDTIFIRPRDPDTEGGDPGAIIPASTSNFSTTYGQHGLSFIGTGLGGSKARSVQTRLKGSATVNATAAFKSTAPYTAFENLTFHLGGSTTSALSITGERTTDLGYSFSSSVYNCMFWKAGATAINGGLDLNSAWHTLVEKCIFYECAIGIRLQSAESDITGVVIRDCDFDGLPAAVNVDILGDGVVHNLLVDGCRFHHDQPTLGATNKYLSLQGATDGVMTGCYFGTEVATLTTAFTQSNLNITHCFYEAATNLTA